MVKSTWIWAAALALAAAAPSAAQDSSQETSQDASTSSAQDPQAAPADRAQADNTDEIVVVAPSVRRDRAMDAFLRGDFETAEIEFDKNYMCVRRIDMLRDFALEQAIIDTEMGRPSGAFGSSAPDAYNFGDKPQPGSGRTCERADWQLYMVAMSQLQQGKRDEAKKTFYRVIRTSRDESLYDAHYRIALLELLDGDPKAAQRRLDHLETLLRRCQRRGDLCEIREELEYVVAYLNQMIA